MLVEVPEEDRAPAHRPAPLVGWLDLDVLVLERAADEERAAVPGNGAVLVDACDVAEGVELGLEQRPRIMARRGHVDGGGRSQQQSIVRSLVVVFASSGVEGALLRSHVASWRRCRLFLERPVKPLEACPVR
jgi:hypothetical protein